MISIVLIGIYSEGCSGQNTSFVLTPTQFPTPIFPIKPTHTVERGQVNNPIEFNVKIVPMLMEELSFHVEGRVDKIIVNIADKIEVGRIHAQIDRYGFKPIRYSESANQVRNRSLNLEARKLKLP